MSGERAERSRLLRPVRQAALELPVLGADPARSAFAEKLRRVALKLAAGCGDRTSTTWLVTSPGAGEGKTLFAANLALVLAEDRGRRVLLIDGDLRNPSVMRFFARGVARGLEAALAGQAGAEDVTCRVEGTALRVLPVVERPPEDKIPGLVQDLGSLLLELRRSFTDVVVDSPPAGLVSDAVRLSRQADAIVLVTRALVSRRDTVLETLEVLGREKLAGVVLNGAVGNFVDRWAANRAYGYGYGYPRASTTEEEQG